MFTSKFWRDTIERVIRSTAWATLGTIGTTKATFQEVDWQIVGGTAGLVAVLSFLACMAGSQVGDRQSASLQSGPPEAP